MKKIFLLLSLLVLVSATGLAQGAVEVPATIKAKFDSLFPNTPVTSWTKEGSRFVASYKGKDNKEQMAMFAPNGFLTETKTKIETSGLPKTANEYIKTNFPGETVEQATKVEYARNRMGYEARLKSAVLQFDTTGALTRRTAPVK